MGRKMMMAALLLLAASPGSPAVAGEKTGNLSVTVEVEGGKTTKDITLTVKDRRVPLEEGKKTHLFKDLPVKRYVVIGDARVKQDSLKGDLRYLGSGEVAVREGKTATVSVTLRPVETVEEFCRPCHPGKGDEVRSRQIARDLHATGIELEKGYIAQVKEYNKNNEKLRKEKKTENLPIVLEERTVTEKGKKVKKTFLVCESCHTLHLDTPFDDQTVAPFRDRSDLCVGCHFD
jgi:hypothetical protein